MKPPASIVAERGGKEERQSLWIRVESSKLKVKSSGIREFKSSEGKATDNAETLSTQRLEEKNARKRVGEKLRVDEFPVGRGKD
jgi:hypothetical protein